VHVERLQILDRLADYPDIEPGEHDQSQQGMYRGDGRDCLCPISPICSRCISHCVVVLF
jgi:hypothetical protein